jgi:hypothetical protein
LRLTCTRRTLEVEPSGELRLLDGRLAGHRDYRIYYKQRVRVQDTRDVVVANKASALREAARSVGVSMSDLMLSIRSTSRAGGALALQTKISDWRFRKRAFDSHVEKTTRVTLRVALRQNLLQTDHPSSQNYIWGN